MLTLAIGKGHFKVCHKEGSRTTVWEVSTEDSEEKLIQTFKDVISFVGGGQNPDTTFGALAQAAGIPPSALRKGLPSAPEPPAQPGNGWKAYTQPEVPERLKGEVELIGEDEAP